jgi:BirA family biotin operon repressor/biotin-[acetyl-CoA-carboxylase] ligase
VVAADRDPHFVVGIGLNVNLTADDFARLGLPEATSLSMAVGQRLDVRGITQLLVRNLDAEYERLLAGELAALEACWQWRLGLDGQPVTVELMDATEVPGRLVELGFAGLAVDVSGDVRQFVPEEIRHVRRAGLVT